jgi:hypothetical protein
MARLTDQEKQEIIRFLEADKPLPEKYRFLLFDDKREVELVWNGKTNEVCNIVLPFQTIEQVDEPRAEGDKKRSDPQMSLFDLDDRGRQLKGWPRKVIGQAHLGRQQADPLQPQERPAARGDRGSGGPQADLHRPALRRRGRLQHGHRPSSNKHGATAPSPRSRTSWKKSPTATPGAKGPIRSSPEFVYDGADARQ